MRIDGSVFLVTGGSSGLGRATVERLAAAGGRIVIADVDAEAARSLVDEIRGQVCFVAADVTCPDAFRRAVDTAVQTYGGLQGLVNCAGIVVSGKVVDRDGNPHPLERFSQAIRINLTGTFNAIRLAAEVMVRQPPGEDGERAVIVNTASVAAFEGQIGQAAYAASKAGVVGLTLPIARELAVHGIRVMTIAPGVFETPMMAGLPDKVQERLAQETPFPPRLGHPGEFAALVQHIIENVMLNAETIRLDGALRMPPK